MSVRLSDLTRAQIDEWRKARMEKGQEKYGDSHLERYNLVDIVEKLLDAQNIICLLQDRLCEEPDLWWDCESRAGTAIVQLEQAYGGIEMVLWFLRTTDEVLPDRYRNDTKGGERVWWSEARRGE